MPVREMPQPGAKPAYVQIYKSPEGGKLHGVILDDVPVIAYQHYDTMNRHCYGCPGPEQCKYCKDGIGKRRYGYLCVMPTNDRTRVIYTLTDAALDELAVGAQGAKSLRGLIILLERKKRERGQNNPTGRVMLRVTGKAILATLPQAVDTLEIIERYLRVHVARMPLHECEQWKRGDNNDDQTDTI